MTREELEKLAVTRDQLVKDWLQKYPKDVDDPDLVQKSMAGMVQLAGSDAFVTRIDYDLWWLNCRSYDLI